MTSFHKRASAWTGSGHRSIAPSSSSPSAQRTQRGHAGEPNPGSRFRPCGHGPHTALAPRWLIASALAEGRAWLLEDLRETRLDPVEPPGASGACAASGPTNTRRQDVRVSRPSTIQGHSNEPRPVPNPRRRREKGAVVWVLCTGRS